MTAGVHAFGAVDADHRTAIEEETKEFICEGLPHVSSTIKHALSAALDLRSTALLVSKRQWWPSGLGSTSNRRVDACGAQSRCVIDVKVLWWCGAGVSSTMICLG